MKPLKLPEYLVSKVDIELGNDTIYNEELTCAKCPMNKDCEYAFDPYNTDGDCLAIK